MNISGIDKVELLRALWEHQQVAGFFDNPNTVAPKFDETEAKRAVLGYIDYFCGRAIKSDISGETACFRLFDRDSKTTAEDIISKLKH